MALSDRDRAIRLRLKDDYEHYAAKCLWIVDKDGVSRPFLWNETQRRLHTALEQQRAETEKVRAIVLKGRQMGVSTYVGGRYYWRVSHERGKRVFILTHEMTASDTLFEMVSTFHDYCPEVVRPTTGKANAKQLSFPVLRSGYHVGTAGAKAVGRGKALQFFHGSEVAFWPHAQKHFAGVVQAIPDRPGTEIILESTANGVGGEFHERWQQAVKGKSDYRPHFYPWFLDSTLRRVPPPGFELDTEEEEYATLWRLDEHQMAWRRAKAAELKDPLLFMQEFPACAEEAFQNTGHDSFIKGPAVIAARRAELTGAGKLVLGVDPARFGDDGFAIAHRRGRKVEKVEARYKLDTVAGAQWVKSVIERDKPVRVFIDVGGLGAGTYDLLADWGYGPDTDGPVRPINFGGAPEEPILYGEDGKELAGPLNRRAEMWTRSRDWLAQPGGADVPDEDAVQADATAPGYTYDTHNRLVIESKEKMRARGVHSPDRWDAIVLTFAESVPTEPTPQNRGGRARGGWMGS